MMKKYLLTSIALLTVVALFAQSHDGHEKCGADIVLQEQLKNPETKANYEAFQEAIQRYTSDPRVAVKRDANGKRIIPVVFHILHSGGPENIGLDKVQQQMDVLNEDFSRLNPDTVNTPERFYGDTEYTHFAFNSDSILAFIDDSAYALLYNLAGESFAFHFTDGSTSFADSLAPNFDNVVEVSIPANADTAAIATAFANAVDAQSGLSANYVYEGQHKVVVSTNDLGYVEDALLAGLWTITVSTPQQGSYLPANPNIEFRLATKDPLGNCTDGVVRVFTSKTKGANDGTGFKSLSYWNSYSYLNIWVVSNIGISITGGGPVLGYAQFPCSGPQSTDGITVIASNINTRGNGGRTATHEIGHWLSLIHIWGDAVCGSDAVFDTPSAEGPNYGVCGNNPAYLGQFGGSSTYYDTPYNQGACDPSNPDGEMFNNYMDYSSDACMNMFTLGQKARMDYTFYGDETDPGCRTYLISQENLELTGTADPYSMPECAPISSFYFEQGNDFTTQKMICAGGSVDFEESAYNGDVDTYAWTFDGGEPGTSTLANPQNIQYDTPGEYDVTLQVSNDQGSSTTTATEMVVVSSPTAQYQNDWGYVDSFWDEQKFLDDYLVFNQDGSQYKWEWYYGENGGSTGWESVRMYNYYSQAAEIDELISPSYDLTTIDQPTLQFRYSGAAVNNEPNDELRIMVSDNCGQTWSTRETFKAFELTNAGLKAESYVPNHNSTWTDVSVSLGSAANKPNVRVKFRWVSSGRSNNFYIDDITIAASPLGMEDLEREIDLNVAPNPTTNATTVTMNLRDKAAVQMQLVDVLGRDARTILNRDMNNGAHTFDIDLSNYANGVYYLRIMVDNNMVVKKIVKN